VRDTVFFTSKIHAIIKIKKNVPLRAKRRTLLTAQINIAFDRKRDRTDVNLLVPF
jgi:hypothetical protein